MRAYSIALDQSGTFTNAAKDRMWHFIGSFDAIPKDCDLMLAVADHDGLHVLEFRCRWRDGCWIETTGRLIDVRPTHWREWPSDT
jgi:hypothetical protein